MGTFVICWNKKQPITVWYKSEYVTVKPVLSGYSKKMTQIGFKTDYRLMQVKSIAAFCNTFDLH